MLSKLWQGQGSFEQMVNVLTFAGVPSVLFGIANEWLLSVPLSLLSGNRYAYVALMQGAYGPTWATIWTVYATAVYAVPWLWGIALSVLGIRRVQRIPLGAAAVTMLVAFAPAMLITTTFTRQEFVRVEVDSGGRRSQRAPPLGEHTGGAAGRALAWRLRRGGRAPRFARFAGGSWHPATQAISSSGRPCVLRGATTASWRGGAAPAPSGSLT